MGDLFKLGLFQFDIVWEDIKANRLKVENLLSGLKAIPDILILPEMFTTGFTMNPNSLDSELLNDQLNWQTALSRKYKLALLGSVVFYDNNSFKNRFIYSFPNGEFDFYDKRHLFLVEKESGFYQSGNKRVIIKHDEIRIMPQICYDLRFPVWSRNDQNYQLLIYVANWPASRQNVWESLLPARAIENQCYVIGVNRVGVDGNNIRYIGGSMVISPKGESIITMGDKEGYQETSLSMNELQQFREKFPVYKDADGFTIHEK